MYSEARAVRATTLKHIHSFDIKVISQYNTVINMLEAQRASVCRLGSENKRLSGAILSVA